MIENILTIMMFLLPPLFAVIIHNYLRHGEMSGKRKTFFFGFYFVLLNLCTYMVSFLRGIREFQFSGMTLSYKFKYMGLGCVLGFAVPFATCLLMEDVITLGGVKRYAAKLSRDLKKYVPYAFRSAKADLRSEVAGSFLNWLWWLIEPFCMMIIYTVIFGLVFHAAEPYFPVFIFTGITMWNFFARNISGSVGIIRGSKGIITKVYLPKFILFLSKMLVNGFKMLVSFGIILLMMAIFKIVPTVNVLYAFPVLIVLFLFTFGVGTILMHYGVYVNDLGYITGIVLNMLMYLTGPFYSVAKRFPEPFGEMFEQFNPMAFLIASMRNALLYGQAPSMGLLCLWCFLSFVLAVLGIFTIYSNENAYVKVI